MRPDVARDRAFWIARRQPFMRQFLHRLAFIDETSLKTNMIKTTGWAPRGERLIDHVPWGHWNTQTFIAALRQDRLDAPWVIKGAIDRDLFDLYIETQLAPTLTPGDVVILDNLATHKSAKSHLHENLVQIPLPVRVCPHPANPLSADFSGEHWVETVPPISNRFVADVDAAFVQQVLHIPERERKPDVRHNRQANNLGTAVKVLEWIAFCHA